MDIREKAPLFLNFYFISLLVTIIELIKLSISFKPMMSNNLCPFSGPFTQWSQQSWVHVSQTVCSALLGVEQITEFEVTEENHFILVFLNFRQQAFLLLLNLALLVWLMETGLGSWKGNISWIISTSSNDIFIYLYTYMFILFVNVFYCVF